VLINSYLNLLSYKDPFKEFFLLIIICFILWQKTSVLLCFTKNENHSREVYTMRDKTNKRPSYPKSIAWTRIQTHAVRNASERYGSCMSETNALHNTNNIRLCKIWNKRGPYQIVGTSYQYSWWNLWIENKKHVSLYGLKYIMKCNVFCTNSCVYIEIQ
jgi:hypothetical protein